MKLILMGTNSFVVPVFDSLSDKHDIIAVFTRAPKPMGRKHILTPSPVHQWAEQKKLPVYTSIKEFDSVNEKPDMIVSGVRRCVSGRRSWRWPTTWTTALRRCCLI